MGWLKLYNTIIDDPKIKAIAPGDRWHFIALLVLKNNGTLDEPDQLRDELIAISLGLQIDEIEALKKRLMKYRLVDENWQPVNWEKLQSAKDKTGAERQRRFRENQAKSKAVAQNAVSNALRNSDTPLPEEEIEVEIEEEIEKTHMSETRVSAPPIPVNEIVELYHQKLPMLPVVRKLTKTRRSYIQQRWRENDLPNLEVWGKYFDYVGQSDFLCGRTQGKDGRPPFMADLEWITKPANYVKIFEGKYHGV